MPARSGGRTFGHAEVYGAVFALAFVVARFAPWLALGHGCPFRAFTGVPCATCGMTRAFVHLAHGEVGAAFGASPFGALLAGGCWLFAGAALARFALGWRWPVLPSGAPRRLAVAALVALLANWVFLVVANRP